MKPARIVMIVLGSLLALSGLALVAGGATLGWALSTQRDGDGFFSTGAERFATNSYALTSTKIELGDPGPDDWWADRELATVRIDAGGAQHDELFVGIGPEDDVERYLAGVPHDEVTDVDGSPFSAHYRRANAAGTATPMPPQDQPFWVAQAAGPGTQRLTWDLEPGDWAIVVMNADASASVIADIEIGGKVDLLVPIAIGLAVGGLVFVALGAALIVGAAAGHHPAGAAAPAPLPGAYPVQLRGHLDPDLSRWRWLVKWFLAIPHYIVLTFLWVAFVVTTLVAFVAILFTGRYPRSIFEFNAGVLRWSWRVGFYATSAIGTDRYPPFTLARTDHPATLEIGYPETLSRGLVLVKSWLLALPHLVIVGLLTSGPTRDNGSAAGPGLVGVLVLIAGVALLFTGRYPTGVFGLLMGINRWIYRVIAYVALMTDRYPPFRLDQGPDEPGDGDEPPPTGPQARPQPAEATAPVSQLVR